MSRPKRDRDFATVVPQITQVNANAHVPLQLSLDDCLPGKVHGWGKVQPTEWGYVAHCLCGWQSRELPTKRLTYYELRSHFGRTPQGVAVLRTLRKVGRGGCSA